MANVEEVRGTGAATTAPAAAAPGTLSVRESLFALIRQIAAATIAVSQQGSAGAGSNAQFFFGSPAIEQAAAFYVRNLALEWLHAQQPMRPRNEAELRTLLSDFLRFLREHKLPRAGPYAASENQAWVDTWSGTSQAAAEAMRQQLVTMVWQALLLNVAR